MTQTAEIINFERPYVKADIDNGYDRLAHDLTNTLARNYASLSGCEYQVVFALISKTFRFQKSEDWIANVQLSEITGMSEAHISKTLRSLKAKNVVIKNGKKTGINPVVSDWKLNQSVKKSKPEKLTNELRKDNQTVNPEHHQNLTNQFDKLNQSVRKVNQSVKNNQPIRPPQKKETNTKETNTKEKPRKRGTQIPDDFSVTSEMDAWAKSKGFTFDYMKETENFVLYWKSEAKPKADWKATWQVWMNRTQERQPARRPAAKHARPEGFRSKQYGEDVVRY